MQPYHQNKSFSAPTFGSAIESRAFASGGYRYGMNGQEKDDELAGTYSAEYWQYDARLGRRWNVDPVVKPNFSPYITFANSPVIFIDPNGDTEFYNSKGVWIGTDNTDNNLIAVTTNGKVLRNIKRNTRKGRYSDFGELKNGDKTAGLFVVNKTVLKTATEILELAYDESKNNPNSRNEFAKVLKEKNNDFVSSGLFNGEGGQVDIPIGDGSGVSIHSHPYGVTFEGDVAIASSPLEPSPTRTRLDGSRIGDEIAFKGYEMNIIVGNIAPVVNEIITDLQRGTEKVQSRGNEPMIVFYNSKTEMLHSMDGGTSTKILEGDKKITRREEKFNKKNEK
jgi:RHS repeat-associated protein